MTEAEAVFRKEYLERIQNSLDQSTKRWSEIQPASYSNLPTPIWEYLGELDDMFIDGHFMGAVLICAAILETALGDQIKKKLCLAPKEIDKFSLDQLIILSRSQEVIDEQEKGECIKLKQLRNDLIHARVEKLDKRAKYNFDRNSPGTGTSFYLYSIGGAGIEEDTAGFVKAIRDLTVKFYGQEIGPY